jgi:hypothetical protein
MTQRQKSFSGSRTRLKHCPNMPSNKKRFGDNRERLKAERLAREASALANKDKAPLKPETMAGRKRSSPAGKGKKAKNKT